MPEPDTRNRGKVFRCPKSLKDVSLQEPACLNPNDYCKSRSACPVHLLEKERKRAS